MIYNNLYYSDEKDILDLKDKSIIPIIPVNCKGVMGAGLALQFKNKYPNLFNEYVDACNKGEVEIGHVLLLFNDNHMFLLFPTKDDWRTPSSLDYIESGLDGVCKFLNAFPDAKIAFPPLGCGLGALQKEDVLPLIYEKTKEYPNDKYLIGF